MDTIKGMYMTEDSIEEALAGNRVKFATSGRMKRSAEDVREFEGGKQYP